MIVLDIGNGSVKWGRFPDGAARGSAPVEAGRLSFDAKPDGFPADIAVSVNPPELKRWKAAHPKLRVVGQEIPHPLARGYQSCGDDRVCALAGALREADAALVLDAGTCLVATAGTRENGVMGGAIAPGPLLMSRALVEGTASLPEINFFDSAAGLGPPGLGKSTAEAIQGGLDAAHVGCARELIARIRREMGISSIFIVSTGTGGESLASRLPEIDAFRAHLPLVGARWAAG